MPLTSLLLSSKRIADSRNESVPKKYKRADDQSLNGLSSAERKQMTDEVQTTPETQPEGESQAPEQTEQAPESETKEEVVEEQQPEVSSEPEQAPKPTRAEKRLQQLLEKGRQAKPQQDPYLDFVNTLPEVTPSDDGSVTTDQLQQIIARETAKNVALAREMDAYHSQVNDFTDEVEAVGQQLEKDYGSNKPLAEKLNGMLADMIEKANVRFDSQGRQVLVPSIRPSQLYSQLKEAVALATQQGTQQATATMANQIAESAVTPTQSEREDLDPSRVSGEQLWKNPTAVREALEARLKVAAD